MKIALLIYPEFSLYEITPLTASLALQYNEKVDIIASQKKLHKSEDGFQVMPHYSIDEIDLTTYELILLTGTMDPFFAVNDVNLINTLSKISLEDTVVASISSSPLLLAKAGLLDTYKFTGGIYRNYFNSFTWLKESNYLPRLCTIDRNLITAIGSSMAVSLFTDSVLAKLHFINEFPELPSEEVSFTLEQNDYEQMIGEVRRLYPNIN
ncbi:DJ-1/PfpI family protein [Streptococcus parauberis]|uniref:DJ-1/PfpI family protein n=1 Tax=Streptococcus parauberis NCFD 2020 TaxID=873447 RepID=F1YYQ4_9STRE|nr:DJ-1/PfpI family protein [Streptococcus parauberis]EGE53634.1 DJ-1/PfpI family protein [Streptococcus parauberis NCFD 2020]